MGNRLSGSAVYLDWVENHGIAVLTIDYRLAPDDPYPAQVDDVFAALAWFAASADDLGVDSERIGVAGVSAGGGIAAATALLARDRSGPALSAQILICPMLDYRNTSVSSAQFHGVGIWDNQSNRMGWDALLGSLSTQSGGVPAYASPSTETDFAGLPPTYIEVGSAEVFRDEDVEYASKIWAAGGRAQLHVWEGAFHTFDTVAPRSALAASAIRARSDWLTRTFALPSGTTERD